MAGKQNDLRIGLGVFGLGQNGQSIDIVHDQVGDDGVEPLVDLGLRGLAYRGPAGGGKG